MEEDWLRKATVPGKSIIVATRKAGYSPPWTTQLSKLDLGRHSKRKKPFLQHKSY